jgi:hypothetical protein
VPARVIGGIRIAKERPKIEKIATPAAGFPRESWVEMCWPADFGAIRATALARLRVIAGFSGTPSRSIPRVRGNRRQVRDITGFLNPKQPAGGVCSVITEQDVRVIAGTSLHEHGAGFHRVSLRRPNTPCSQRILLRHSVPAIARLGDSGPRRSTPIGNPM